MVDFNKYLKKGDNMSQDAAATEVEVKTSSLVVDLASLENSGIEEVVDYDPNANAFEGPPPPPDGTHRFKLKLNKEGWKLGTTKKGASYLSNRITCQCVAEGDPFNNIPSFYFASTLIFEGKSRMAGILKACGVDVPRGLSPKEMAELFENTLKAEPIVRGKGRWLAQEKDPNDDSKYINVAVGMKTFPPVKDENQKAVPGRYNPVIVSKNEVECKAQFDITEFLPDVG